MRERMEAGIRMGLGVRREDWFIRRVGMVKVIMQDLEVLEDIMVGEDLGVHKVALEGREDIRVVDIIDGQVVAGCMGMGQAAQGGKVEDRVDLEALDESLAGMG